jgi:hypothetical protein
MEENILLKVGIDQNQIAQSEKAIVSARVEIDKLKEANKQLETQGDKNSVQYVKNQTEIKNLSNTVRENERVLQANAKMVNSASGSIDQLRAQLALNTQQWNKLSEEERENTEVGKALSKQKLDLTNKLKAEEKATGDTRRNVGNYTEGVQEAFAASGLFGGQIGKLTTLKKSLTAATKVSVLGLKGFRLALIATGIGAIVALLGGLISAFLSTQKGIDTVTKVTRPLIAVFQQLKGLVQDLATNVFGGLGKILSGDIKGGLKDLGNAFTNAVGDIGEAIEKGAESGKQLDELQKSIEKTEIELIKRRAELNNEFAKSKEIAQDLSKTEAERTKAAQDAINAQNELLEREQKFLDLKIEKKKLENSLNDTSREDEKELAELIAERTQKEAEASKKRASANSLLRSAEKQAENEVNKSIAEREKLEEAANKKRVEDLKKANDEIIAEQKRVTEQFKESIKEREQATQLEIRDTVNELKRQFAEGQITPDEFQKQLAEIEAVAIETRRAAFELQLEETRNNAQIEADTKLAIEADLQQKLRDLDDQTLDVRVKNAQAELDAQKKANDEQKKDAQELEDAKIEAATSVLNAAKDIFGAESAAGKIAATFQATIDTYVAANKALSTIPPPFGQIVAGATIATGLANVAKINSRPAPKFAEGGGIEIAGPSHAGGGVDVALGGQTVANVEGGEGLFVMKKDAFQSLKSLSNYNQMFGGNSWFGGGKKFLADGGAITRGSTPQLDRRSLQEAQTSIGNAMQQINVITRVTDINRVSDEMKLVEMQGELR